MATREKKARSVTADSPTPSLGSAHSGSNSNISTIGGTPTSTTGTAAAETKGAGGDGGGSLSAPTTPTSSRKGAGAAANVNSGGGGSVAATGGGSGGSTASSASSSSSTRASLSRLKSKQLLLGDDPVANEEPVTLAGSEGASSTTTTPSRTTRRGGSIARDDSTGVDANAPAASAASSKDKEDMPLSAAAGSSKDLTKSPAIGARRAAAVAAAAVVGSSSKQSTAAGKGEPTVANSRKHRVVSLKRTALLKRKGKKIIGKPILGKKVVARRQLAASVAATKGKSSTVRGASSTTMPMKKETTATISPASTGGSREDTASDLLSTPSLRNGKPRNSDSPVAKRKSAGSALKREINKSPDQQLIKLERRRSCSVSKFSSEDGGEGTAAAGFEFKRELLDDEVRSKMLDKMAEAFNGRKLEVATPGGTLRRSMRQRKSTARDKDDFVTPRLKGASSMVDIKVELDTAEDDEADGGTPQTEPLTIDTSEAEKQDVPLHSDGAASASSIDETVSEVGVDGAGDVGVVGVGETPGLVEKDASLSPELISEGVSELSVKECYSEPAFLENNLGIEKDPKLGEIVQGRFRCDKVSDDSGACEEEEEEEEEEGKLNASGGGGGGGDEEEHAQGQSVVSVVEEVKDVTEEDGKEEHRDHPDSASVEIVKQKDCESEDVQDQLMIVDEDDQPAEVVEDGIAATATLSSECKLDEDLLNEEAEEEEEEDMEVVVELESGKADSDAETISSVVASSTVEATAVVKDEDEPDGEDEDEDVLMVEEPTVTEGDGEEMMEDEEEEVVVKVATPTPSTVDNTAVVEVVVEEGDHEDSKDEPKLEELVDGGEKKGAGDNSVPETTPQTETAEDGTAAQSNGGIVPDGEEQQSTVVSNQQQTPRLEKAPIGCSSPGSSATPKASAKSTGGTGASSSSSSSSGSSTSSVKEGKSKSRTGKEKSKDDEKTREEKLRQEKLRVEEKVREEKLRAELRLKEELEQKQKKKEAPVVVLENGTGEDVSSLVGGSSSPSTVTGEKSTADAERELKTDQAVTALIKLPAITIMQKDSSSSSNKNTVGGTTKRKSSRDAVESVGETVKVELEILPIPSDAAAPLTAVKEEKSSVEATLPSVDSVESPLEIISKSEQAAAAVTITVQKAVVDGVADGNKSPVPSSSSSPSALSVIKIESDPTSSDGAGVEAATSADGSGEGASKEDTTSTGGKEGKRNGTDALVAQLPADKASILQVVSGTKDEEPQKAPEAASAPPRLDESDDVAKQKESHLKLFGLLTIRAACEEMKRRTEQKPSTSTTGALVGEGGAAAGGQGAAGEGWLAAAIGQSGSSSGGSGGGRNGNKSTRGSRDEYTVSMKTSAALGGKGGGGGSGRGEKRKQQRMPLKMTFQKGKGKGSSGGGGNGGAVRDSSNGSGTSSSNGSSAMAAGGYATEAGNNGQGDASTFYTIHSNELDHHSSNSSDGHSHRDSSTGGRKAHSRSHTTDGVNLSEAVGESSSTDKVIQKSLVIPEKASSFNVHPERLCQDQCFYCGGKFGLYDTPCHIAAIKSTERQQKILLAESKITLDSCLCDACFRHVDRKANYPSQKKKTSSSGGPQQNSASSSGASSSGGNAGSNSQSTVSPIVIKMTTNKDGSTSITGQQNHHHQPMVIDDGSGGPGSGKAREICAVRQCTAHALQALRRKWVLKMKRKIGKHLDINLEQAARATTENISICNRHYEQISHLMICAMCTKPLQRNQVYHMYNNIPQLERLIQEQGLAIRLSSSELVVCKLCRHYANLLFKPPDPKSQKAQFISTYNRRLCSSRQRETKEQNELQQQQQQQQQDVEVQSVEPLLGGVSVNDGETAAGRQSTVDIVISDGDEEENEEEDVEVHQQPANQQKFQKVSELFSIGENSVSLRRRGSSRKSPDVSIIESSSSNNSMAQMSDRLGEITIIPTTKTFTSTNHHNQQQQQQQQDDNFDMTRVLKSNPNISMRELFPGEEELGVHVNIPFSSSSMRTPEGWTKVTSTIQYDDSTRALWEELQKPYGNQSSFLRHLILLEKYFRNGDLVLSPQAKTNATTYSEAVQNRLRSFDHVPTPLTSPPALASFAPASATSVQQQQDKTTSIFQQFSSATITIVPASKARPKAPSSQGPGTSGSGSSSSSGNASNTAASPEGASVASVAPVSLLKSNNLRLSVSEKVSVNSLKRKLSNEGKSTSGSTSAAATTAPGSASSAIVSKVAKLDEPKGVPSAPPPELISINRKSTGSAISAIPTTTLTASTATAPVSSKPQPQQQQSLLQPATTQPAQQSQSSNQAQGKRSPPSYAASTAGGASTSAPSTNIDHRDVIHVMPEQLTETEREETSAKPWRPTLLPIAPGVTESLKYGPLYQTADGRLLPMLVQVMSGGKPYHISIGDYNRMCILRREKLIQQQHNITQSTTTAAAAAAVASSTAVTAVAKRSSLPARPAATTTTTSTSPGSTAASLPPPGLRLSLSSTENTPISSGSTTITPSTNASTAAASARLVQVPNQILEQNSLIPIAGGSTLGGGSGGGSRLDLYRQKQNSSNTSNNSSSLTVTMTTSHNNNNNNNHNHSLAKTSISAANTVKPLSLPNSTTVYPMVISANTISLPSASGNASSLAGSGGGNGGGPLGLMYSQASSIGRSNATTSLVLTQQQSTASSNTVNVSVNSSSSSSISNPLDQLLKGGKHVTQSQLQAFAAAAASSNGGLAGSLLDNSPAQLLSKIPKSLTVIPQQKQRSMSRVSSHEDQHSA